MYQNQQWKGHEDQPGLFTFYVQQETREVGPTKNGETRLSHHLQQTQMKKQIKLRRATQRYTTNYSGWRFTKCLEKNESKQLKRANLSHAKNPQIKIRNQKSTELVSSLKMSNDGKSKKSNSKSEIQLKKRNMNECFGFDINKCKSRMFIFRGEPVRLVKRNYKETVEHTSINKKSQQKKDQAYKSLNPIKSQQRAINSDVERHPTIKLRYNFVQFLNERRKKQKIDKLKQITMHRSDLRLSRLLSLNKPEGLYLRSKTER